MFVIHVCSHLVFLFGSVFFHPVLVFWVRCWACMQAAGRSRAEEKGLVVVVPRLVSGGYRFALVDDREKLCVCACT